MLVILEYYSNAIVIEKYFSILQILQKILVAPIMSQERSFNVLKI